MIVGLALSKGCRHPTRRRRACGSKPAVNSIVGQARQVDVFHRGTHHIRRSSSTGCRSPASPARRACRPSALTVDEPGPGRSRCSTETASPGQNDHHQDCDPNNFKHDLDSGVVGEVAGLVRITLAEAKWHVQSSRTRTKTVTAAISGRMNTLILTNGALHDRGRRLLEAQTVFDRNTLDGNLGLGCCRWRLSKRQREHD